MKILIVGLGSMGKRRARLTKGIDSSIRIAGVDTAESRRAEATDLGLIDAAYLSSPARPMVSFLPPKPRTPPLFAPLP